ncbi:GNAT family N-acetyltransferase [Tepidibacter hydrothermalis]|uniref:GNAT family N-acetyltransferase n=1 Tax=Tepidibacter hydrothermalis TaxID=3036126 RepID=A0ABY8E737_9FIRM|nr:GNAT family N-acetyltransferase [Tepidibacter hydrothermalis]WFD08705.1 GNAT family N-acetyltransferase [Tepidibacter hydrothermalis]
MLIRKARIEDLKIIMNIISNAINDMESKGIYQWDNTYPNKEVFSIDILKNNLYVYVDKNIIHGFIALNEHQEDEYESLKWKYISGKHLIVHRLCVDPKYQGKGIAKNLIQFTEKYAKENNYESIRLDAFSQNEQACKLYANFGYNKVGMITFRKGGFYCFEKGFIK